MPSPRRDPQLVDRPVAQRIGERLVHEAVLIQEREPLEARTDDRDVEVVAAAGAVDDVERPASGNASPSSERSRVVPSMRSIVPTASLQRLRKASPPAVRCVR